MKAFLNNIHTLANDPFVRYCFFNGIDEAEKEKLFRLSMENPFTCLDIAKAYIKTGRDFEELAHMLEQANS